MSSKTAFVTVGSTKFETLIDRLLDDDVLHVLEKYSFNRMIIQIGNGKHKILNVDEGKTCLELIKNNVQIIAYKYKQSIRQDLEQADLVISHAGAGSVIESLEANKKLIVVINESLMNNHQFELADRMYKEGYLLYSRCSNLNIVLEDMLGKNSKISLKKYEKGQPKLFAQYLDDYLRNKNVF